MYDYMNEDLSLVHSLAQAEGWALTCLSDFLDIVLLVHEHLLGQLCSFNPLQAFWPGLSYVSNIAQGLFNPDLTLGQDLHRVYTTHLLCKVNFGSDMSELGSG